MKEYAFGIDLGGTTAKVGLFTTSGALLEKWEVPTDTSNAGEHILENLADAIHAKMAEKEILSEQVEGVGIGVPGPVLDSRIVPIICANLGGWGERNVSAQLSGLQHGCLEQYSSATGVVRCMKKLLDENPDADCVLRGRDFEAKDVFDAARNGDALAAREVDEMTDTLGMALATIAATVDPEMFMIGGGVSRAGDVLFAPLREHFKVYAFKSCRETPIVPAILGNDAGIYGSVRLIVGE